MLNKSLTQNEFSVPIGAEEMMNNLSGNFEFNVTFEGDFSGLFPEPPAPDCVFKLVDDGKVISYIKFEAPGKDYAPRWFFFSLLDQMVWKYALIYGLQLEDAIRELNRYYSQQHSVNVGITIFEQK